MPAARSRNALSQMLSPLSEDELEQAAFDNTLDSNMENLDPTPKPRTKGASRSKAAAARPTAAKVTKAKAPSRRTSGGSAVPRKKAVTSRKVLAERDAPNASETEEVEEVGEEEEQAAPSKSRNKGVEYGFDGYPKRAEPERSTATRPRTKPSGRAPSKARASRYVAETQPESMDVEQSIEEVTEIHVPPPATSRLAHRSESIARHGSKQRQTSVPRSRAGSVSDREGRSTDPALRRKLGDLTKKFENLDIKYRQLKDIAMRDTETNFDKLRRSADQRAKDQEDIIASLKRELAAERSNRGDTKTLKAESANLKAETQRLSAENTRITTEAKACQNSLTEAQNDLRSLTTKLATTRESLKAAEAMAAAAKMPGSAAKGPQKGAALNSSAALGGDTAVLKLKEELYSDLTGLMVRAVKKVDQEDVFDCIQTGRNGTLHFHLSVPPIPVNADGSSNFDDAEFAYTPLLDERNDRELLELLPDYLTEEICFPRSSAAKFYAKVLDSMTRKVVVEE